MPLSICDKNDYPNEIGDYLMTNPDGEFLTSWRKQPLTINLVSRIVDEAYRCGLTKGMAQLVQVKQLLKE